MNPRHTSQRASHRIARAGRRARPAHFDGRERLLDAAIALFAERGIANTTVGQIAAAGRVTSAMVHYWFDTREKLLDAVVDERLVPHIRHLWDPADADRDSPLGLVRGLVTRMLDITEKAPWLPSLWLREIIQEGGLLRERVLQRIPADPNAAFRRNIARAQERGEIDPQIAPELLFISMFALVMLPQAAVTMPSTTKMVRRFNPSFVLDRAKLERHVMVLLMHGLMGTGATSAGSSTSSSRSTE
ncbi:MAG TPA: TetR/AcrR family transcriptional regulator [Steroidobacteraceae bacterium]|nr:TetR/AcrR family transcriptional regulator [Steroidobacteraceae bacterium]